LRLAEEGPEKYTVEVLMDRIGTFMQFQETDNSNDFDWDVPIPQSDGEKSSSRQRKEKRGKGGADDGDVELNSELEIHEADEDEKPEKQASDSPGIVVSPKSTPAKAFDLRRLVPKSLPKWKPKGENVGDAQKSNYFLLGAEANTPLVEKNSIPYKLFENSKIVEDRFFDDGSIVVFSLPGPSEAPKALPQGLCTFANMFNLEAGKANDLIWPIERAIKAARVVILLAPYNLEDFDSASHAVRALWKNCSETVCERVTFQVLRERLVGPPSLPVVSRCVQFHVMIRDNSDCESACPVGQLLQDYLRSEANPEYTVCNTLPGVFLTKVSNFEDDLLRRTESLNVQGQALELLLSALNWSPVDKLEDLLSVKFSKVNFLQIALFAPTLSIFGPGLDCQKKVQIKELKPDVSLESYLCLDKVGYPKRNPNYCIWQTDVVCICANYLDRYILLPSHIFKDGAENEGLVVKQPLSKSLMKIIAVPGAEIIERTLPIARDLSINPYLEHYSTKPPIDESDIMIDEEEVPAAQKRLREGVGANEEDVAAEEEESVGQAKDNQEQVARVADAELGGAMEPQKKRLAVGGGVVDGGVVDGGAVGGVAGGGDQAGVEAETRLGKRNRGPPPNYT
jgi:hypothetical protein